MLLFDASFFADPFSRRSFFFSGSTSSFSTPPESTLEPARQPTEQEERPLHHHLSSLDPPRAQASNPSSPPTTATALRDGNPRFGNSPRTTSSSAQPNLSRNSLRRKAVPNSLQSRSLSSTPPLPPLPSESSTPLGTNTFVVSSSSTTPKQAQPRLFTTSPRRDRFPTSNRPVEEEDLVTSLPAPRWLVSTPTSTNPLLLRPPPQESQLDSQPSSSTVNPPCLRRVSVPAATARTRTSPSRPSLRTLISRNKVGVRRCRPTRSRRRGTERSRQTRSSVRPRGSRRARSRDRKEEHRSRLGSSLERRMRCPRGIGRRRVGGGGSGLGRWVSPTSLFRLSRRCVRARAARLRRTSLTSYVLFTLL